MGLLSIADVAGVFKIRGTFTRCRRLICMRLIPDLLFLKLNEPRLCAESVCDIEREGGGGGGGRGRERQTDRDRKQRLTKTDREGDRQREKSGGERHRDRDRETNRQAETEKECVCDVGFFVCEKLCASHA